MTSSASTSFEPAVVTAVLAHMNGDHNDDNLTIARAFGHAEATAAVMSDLDSEGGTWQVTTASGEHELRVPWPGGVISERPEIRREVVAVHTEACRLLGIEPDPH